MVQLSVSRPVNGSADVAPFTGWERELLTSNTFMADAALPPATQPFDKKAAIIAMSVLDCFGVVLYFVVTLGLILVARKLAHDADMHTVKDAYMAHATVCWTAVAA